MNKQSVSKDQSRNLREEEEAATNTSTRRNENSSSDENNDEVAAQNQTRANMLSAASKMSVTKITPNTPLDKLHSRASSLEYLSIPALGISDVEPPTRHVLPIPSIQLSDLSLDDASSSTETRPYRSRSHAVDLMGLDLSSLKCNDDATTGKHYIKIGSTEIQHPAHHRRVSSSSRVAFAVAAYMAEQGAAALSEKAADFDVDVDDDSDGFNFTSDFNSEASESSDLADQFSFWEDYSCSCSDDQDCVHGRPALQKDLDNYKDEEDELLYEGQQQDDDDDGGEEDGGEEEQEQQQRENETADHPRPSLTLSKPTPRTPKSSSDLYKTELETSPVSIAHLTLH